MSRRKQVLLRKFKVEIFRPADMDESVIDDLLPATDVMGEIIEKALAAPLEKVDRSLDFYVSEDDG
jgi:hypothetical protein